MDGWNGKRTGKKRLTRGGAIGLGLGLRLRLRLGLRLRLRPKAVVKEAVACLEPGSMEDDSLVPPSKQALAADPA